MAAADVHPVWMCRAPTIVSMQQLEDDYVASDKAAAAQPLQCVARPEAPVAEAVGACLARYSFPALECKIHPPQKRVRSFGDLNNALVPNIEEGSDGWCAPSHIVPIKSRATAIRILLCMSVAVVTWLHSHC